jgi:hypothetical protein
MVENCLQITADGASLIGHADPITVPESKWAGDYHGIAVGEEVEVQRGPSEVAPGNKDDRPRSVHLVVDGEVVDHEHGHVSSI